MPRRARLLRIGEEAGGDRAGVEQRGGEDAPRSNHPRFGVISFQSARGRARPQTAAAVHATTAKSGEMAMTRP
jgi:hypothetical protein